jgi:uncharacterized protein YcfL
MKTLVMLSVMLIILVSGCSKPKDSRVNIQSGVGNDSLGNNLITRPFAQMFSAIIGEGIVVNEVKPYRNESDFLEVEVKGFNKSYNIKRFYYRVDWIDANGNTYDSKTSVWIPVSAMSKSAFSFKTVAPSKDIVNFYINTRKGE